MSPNKTYEDDHLWNTGDAGRLEVVAASLPPLFSCGSILVDRGELHFKGPPLVSCPHCGGSLQRGQTTLTFRNAPAESQTQPVEGWVCPCGERYVPGKAAREAYRKAFRGETASQPRAGG